MELSVKKLLIKPGGICERLATARLDAGYNGKEFATAVGWDPAKVSRIEAGLRTVTAEDLETWISRAGIADSRADELRAALEEVETCRRYARRERRRSDRRDAVEFPATGDSDSPATTLEVYQRGYADCWRDIQAHFARFAVPSLSELEEAFGTGAWSVTATASASAPLENGTQG